MKKINTGQILQINAIAMDTLGLKIPKILELLGLKITNQEYMDTLIEAYGEGFYEWLSEYVSTALPSYEGNLPSELTQDEEIRNFVYDLLMNFYIARMLIIELNSPYAGGNAPDDKDDTD